MNIEAWSALVLLGALGVGLSRALRDEARAARVVAAQLFGTLGVAIVLLIPASEHVDAAVDVALVLSLLAAISTVVFVRRGVNYRRGSVADAGR